MQAKKVLIIAVIGIIAAAVIVGVAFALRHKNSTPSVNSQEVTTGQSSETNGDVHFEHTTGDAVVEFDEGNEAFFDASLTAYLERMEFGTPAMDEDGNYYFDADGDIVYDMSEEKHLEGVLDNLITLINHFAKEEYSMEASRQIQRFYVTYYDRFLETKYEDLVANIAKCFPKEGADPETLAETMLEVFGFNRGDGFAFVFSPIEVAPIRVEFYNVLPATVIINDELERLCIYDGWHNEEDDGYERNLEGWLHNVIQITKEAGLPEEKIIAAQILYAGSLANAEYRSEWKEALIRCFTIEDLSYDNFKLAVESEFCVCTDYNVPLMDYFAAVGSEVDV